MKPSEIIQLIEKTAPPDMAAPWDKCGIQVASPQREVTHLAVMLDATPRAVQTALDAGADMILAHHPLSMEPRFPNALCGYTETLRLLFRHDVLLYSAHTSLDTNLSGPAGWLADELKLVRRAPLDPIASCKDAPLPCGFGIAGDLPQPLGYAEFTDLLAHVIGKTMWRACGPMPSAAVTRIAYCTGSGASLMEQAAASGASVYITGDVKYHAALESPIRVLDVGHFILEEVMMRRFAASLRQTCDGLAVTFIPSSDPFVCEGVA